MEYDKSDLNKIFNNTIEKTKDLPLFKDFYENIDNEKSFNLVYLPVSFTDSYTFESSDPCKNSEIYLNPDKNIKEIKGSIIQSIFIQGNNSNEFHLNADGMKIKVKSIGGLLDFVNLINDSIFQIVRNVLISEFYIRPYERHHQLTKCLLHSLKFNGAAHNFIKAVFDKPFQKGDTIQITYYGIKAFYQNIETGKEIPVLC